MADTITPEIKAAYTKYVAKQKQGRQRGWESEATFVRDYEKYFQKDWGPNGERVKQKWASESDKNVVESTALFQKGDTVTITADSKHKGEKCKVLSVDRGFEILEVTMVNFPGSHIRSDWKNFSKAPTNRSVANESVGLTTGDHQRLLELAGIPQA